MAVNAKTLAGGIVEYEADYRDETGRRIRQRFATKKAANEFLRDQKKIIRALKTQRVELISRNREDLGPQPDAPMKLTDAIAKYKAHVRLAKQPDTIVAEKVYLGVLYEFLIEVLKDDTLYQMLGDEEFPFVHRIKLIHLESLRSFLQTTPLHNLCLRDAKRRRDQSEYKALLENDSRVSFHFEGLPRCKDKSKCRAQILTNASINRYFNGYMDFFSFCDRVDALVKNPIRHIEPLAENPYVRVVPEVKTTQAVISWLDENGFQEDAEALETMHILGPRPSCLERNNWGHVDFVNRVVTYLSMKGRKGKKYLRPRTVPLTDRAYELYLARFERARRNFRAKPEDPVFLSASGDRFDGSAFARRVKMACDALGIEDFSAYCVRHWVVTAMRKLRIDLADIGMVVGHSNLNTTAQVYSHLEAEHLKAPLTLLNSSSVITREKWTENGQKPRGCNLKASKKTTN